MIGSISCIILVSVLSFVLMYGLRRVRGSWNLRLAPEAELEGIDKYCHGAIAYTMEVDDGIVLVARDEDDPLAHPVTVRAQALLRTADELDEAARHAEVGTLN